MPNFYDKIVIGLVAVAAFLSVPISLWANSSASAGPPHAIVSISGKDVLEIDLRKDNSDIPVLGSDELCALEVKNGEVRVKRSKCKNKLCIRKGSVSGGEEIVCLPHRIVVRTLGQNSGSPSRRTEGKDNDQQPRSINENIDALSY